MNNLTTLFLASLLFHTASPSKDPKSSRDPKSTEAMIDEKFKTALKLAKTFRKGESAVGDKTEIYVADSDILMPFDFPNFETYDMALATRLSKRSELSPKYIFSYLVQVIYKLVQFHVTRFFKVHPSELLVPARKHDNIEDWKNSPQGWFQVLFSAIMPGAVFYPSYRHGRVKLNRIYVEPFTFLSPGDNTFAYTNYVNGVPEKYMAQHEDEMSVVVVYTLPSSSFGQILEANQAITIGMKLERSYPHCKGILEYLLKGVTFAIDLRSSNIEVIVKPTEDILPVKKSMRALKALFKTPLKAQIVVPENVERILHNGMVPRLSCYHPANGSLGHIELYERMMMLIVAGRALLMFRLDPDYPLDSIIDDLRFWLKSYLPDASVRSFTENLPGVQLYTYNPNLPSMWLYKGEIDGKETGILLRFGNPVMLSHEQMNNIVSMLYPYGFKTPVLENARTPVEKIAKCIIGEIEKRNVSASSSLMTKEKGIVDAFEKDKKALNVIVRLLDGKSRNYSRNTASRFESPSAQKRVYEQSRRASLEGMFGTKLSIIFNAFKHSSTSNARPHEVMPSLFERNVRDLGLFYSYVSRCSNSHMACEGTETISFPPGFDISKLISIPYEKYMNDPMFKDATVVT